LSSIPPDLGVIPPDPLSCGKPSVFLLGNHLFQAGPVLEEWRKDQEDIANVRLEVSEGAVEDDRRDLAGVNVNMDSGYDGL